MNIFLIHWELFRHRNCKLRETCIWSGSAPRSLLVKKYPPKLGLRGTLIQSGTRISFFLWRGLPSNERDLSFLLTGRGYSFSAQPNTVFWFENEKQYRNKKSRLIFLTCQLTFYIARVFFLLFFCFFARKGIIAWKWPEQINVNLTLYKLIHLFRENVNVLEYTHIKKSN